MPANKRRKLSQDNHSMALIPTQPVNEVEGASTTALTMSGVAEGSAKESWDCTGLVPRYTSHSEMPKNIQKCRFRPQCDCLPLLQAADSWVFVIIVKTSINAMNSSRCTHRIIS